MTSKSKKLDYLLRFLPESQTPIDRTTAAARLIIEDEAIRQSEKVERLRAARLERSKREPDS